MVDVDKLSDAELRTKLLEFGFPVMPITGTTRKVMTKKLKLLLENKNKNNSDGRRSLGRYSSEEESDGEVSTRRADKNRRATMAAPIMQPPTSSGKITQRKSARINDSVTDEAPHSSKNVLRKEVTTTTTRTSRILQNTPRTDDFDTGSDSESEIVGNEYSSNNNSYSRSSPVKPSLSYSTSNSPTNKYSPTKSTDRDSSYGSRNVSFSPSPGRAPSFIASANAAEERLNQIKSRLSLGSGYQPLYSSTSSSVRTPVSDRGDGNIETPFLSNFTKRLSQLSPQKTSDYEYKNDIIKEHDTNGAGSYSTRTVNRPLRSRDLIFTYKNGSQSSVLKNNIVPFAVLAVAFLFFVFVIIMYLGIRSDTTIIETAGYTIPYCVKSDPKTKKGVNCVLETDLKNAINLLHVLEPELARIAVEKVCKNPRVRSHMTEEEIVAHIQTNYALQDDTQIRHDLTNLEILAFKNPAWGIHVLQSNKIDDPVSKENAAQNMEQVIFNRETKVTSLAILEPSIPWRCAIYQKLYTVFTTLISIACIFAALYFGKTAYKYYKVYDSRQREEVIFMVEKIIDVLQTNASEDGDNYLVINHVRDLILPINERKRKQGVWAKAVTFINENESRIRTEVQEVQGEPFEVWRWLGSANLNMSGGSPKNNKSWQGQAFETQTGSVNSLPCSPTPCLKIRGMVEDGDRNTHMIREAILSKCAQQCRVLHCAVDVNSKCVYLKCSDTGDAAVAYRNLHGWWYAGHLVTVKYLRLERYMQRFPDSPTSGPPFLKAIAPNSEW